MTQGLSKPHSPLRLLELPWRYVFALLLGCIVAIVGAHLLRPDETGAVPLMSVRDSIPSTVGDWREVKSTLVQMPLTPQGDRSEAVAATYDESLLTTFVDSSGRQVMVALAYGRSQRQEGKIHRPELCYSSQGFSVDGLPSVSLALSALSDKPVPVNRLITSSRGRREIVSYWIRIGDGFSTNPVFTRLYILKEGLMGRIPDGILVRVSQIIPGDLNEEETLKAFQLQEDLMRKLATSDIVNSSRLLLGR